MGFVGGGVNIAIATALSPFFLYCIVNIQTVYGIDLSNCLRLLEAAVLDVKTTQARSVQFLLSAEYSVVMCGACFILFHIIIYSFYISVPTLNFIRENLALVPFPCYVALLNGTYSVRHSEHTNINGCREG